MFRSKKQNEFGMIGPNGEYIDGEMFHPYENKGTYEMFINEMSLYNRSTMEATKLGGFSSVKRLSTKKASPIPVNEKKKEEKKEKSDKKEKKEKERQEKQEKLEKEKQEKQEKIEREKQEKKEKKEKEKLEKKEKETEKAKAKEKEKGKKKEKDSDKQGNSKVNEEVSKVIVKSEVDETVAQGFQKEKTEDVEKSNKIEKANLKNEANSKTTKGIVCILFFQNIMITKSLI